MLLHSSCSTVSLVLRTSSAKFGASGAGRCEERTFYSKCNEVETGGHGMMGWGPAASMLKDMPVRTQHIWSEAPSSTQAKIRQGTARAVQCIIYAQSLQVNPPNPAVCHGTLRLPLRGDHGHVPRPHIDPISLYLVTLRSQGVFPQVPGNKKYGRKK